MPLAFSVALCRGLIEAERAGAVVSEPAQRFPWLYAAASLKRDGPEHVHEFVEPVFRGFMPRPH